MVVVLLLLLGLMIYFIMTASITVQIVLTILFQLFCLFLFFRGNKKDKKNAKKAKRGIRRLDCITLILWLAAQGVVIFHLLQSSYIDSIDTFLSYCSRLDIIEWFQSNISFSLFLSNICTFLFLIVNYGWCDSILRKHGELTISSTNYTPSRTTPPARNQMSEEEYLYMSEVNMYANLQMNLMDAANENNND